MPSQHANRGNACPGERRRARGDHGGNRRAGSADPDRTAGRGVCAADPRAGAARPLPADPLPPPGIRRKQPRARTRLDRTGCGRLPGVDDRPPDRARARGRALLQRRDRPTPSGRRSRPRAQPHPARTAADAHAKRTAVPRRLRHPGRRLPPARPSRRRQHLPQRHHRPELADRRRRHHPGNTRPPDPRHGHLHRNRHSRPARLDVQQPGRHVTSTSPCSTSAAATADRGSPTFAA